MRARQFVVAGAAILLSACVGVGVALADPGEVSALLRQYFGGQVKSTRADGSAAQAGDVPTKQSNGSIAYAAPTAGGSQTPWTGNVDAAGHDLTDTGNIFVGATARLSLRQGGDLASTGDMNAGAGNYFVVTGSTTIVTVGVGAQAGETMTMRFSGAPLLTHAGSGEGAALALAGAVNWQTTAGDTITVTYDGTVWREVARTYTNLTIYGSASISGPTSATVTDPTMVWSSLTPKALTQAETSGQTWITTGATGLVDLTLPDAPTIGARATFVLDGAYSLVVRANTGDRIRSSAGVTTTAGYLYTALHASTITLMRCSSTEWLATETTGTWAMDSTTSAGYAYTPTPWTALTSISHTWDADADVSESGLYRQSGDVVECDITLAFAGAPPTSTLTLSAITGHVSFLADEAKMQGLAPGVYDLYMCGGIGTTCSYDASVAFSLAIGTWYSESANNWQPNLITLPGTLAAITQAVPWTWASGDKLHLRFSFPVQ